MKPTVCCGLLMVTCCDPLTEMNITIWVGIRVDEVPSWQAFARTLVMRIVRWALVPGASIGRPNQASELAPTCWPWNILDVSALPPLYGPFAPIPPPVPKLLQVLRKPVAGVTA